MHQLDALRLLRRSADHRSRLLLLHEHVVGWLITEAEFDAVLERLKAQGLDYSADPARRRPRRSIAMTADAASISRTPTVMVSK